MLEPVSSERLVVISHAAKATMLIAANSRAGPSPTSTIVAANIVSVQATIVSIEASFCGSVGVRGEDSSMRVDKGSALPRSCFSQNYSRQMAGRIC